MNILKFETPEFTVSYDGRHAHGFLLSAELAEEFMRIVVSFPFAPPVGVTQSYRLKDSSGRLYAGAPGEEQGNAKFSFRTWSFDRLADDTTSFSVELALSGEGVPPADGDYALINGLII